MNIIELLDIIESGETSKVQFKREISHNDSLAAEIVAMLNSIGGIILLGIEDKTGKIIGVDLKSNINERLANIFTNHLNPTAYLTTDVVALDDENNSKIIIVNVPEGTNKPYKDNNGSIWVKQGSDKRRVTDNNEILRLFQSSKNLFADEMEVNETSIEEIDAVKFEHYFNKEFKQSFQNIGLTFEQALKAKRIIRNNQLTLAGLLFFGKRPQNFKPAFTIKVVSFFGNDESSNQYRNKPNDLVGTIPELFEQSMMFLKANLNYLQPDNSFNSQGKLEVSLIALEEVIINALVHRDYFKNSPIRILIFDDRIEVISPGKLPNSLSVEDIKYGNPVIRNNQILTFSLQLLPISGLGTGIKRALKEQPNIEFLNQEEGEQFIVKIPRQSSL